MEYYQITKKFSTQSDYCVSLLSGLHTAGTHMDTKLCSAGTIVLVHSAILSRCSEVLADMLASTESNLIILPGFSAVLSHFVSLIYTGQASRVSEKDMDLITSLCKELGVSTLPVVNRDIHTVEDTITTMNTFNHVNLKVESKISNEPSEQIFPLRLPMSRLVQKSRRDLIGDYDYVFDGFKGRIQDDYNKSPVGPYEGPYDQHPQVPLFAQLPKSGLNYEEYTNFVHPDDLRCKIFEIKQNYEDIDDLEKIEALKIRSVSTEIFDTSDDDEKVNYTCMKKSCKIPCPCHICSSVDNSQCPDHNMKHVDLFDQSEHLFSVRTTELSCSSESFFLNSYVLKYPGIPKACDRCRKDLLHHKSYHLKFHWKCKFCKFYQYKLYPKSIKELHKRESQEQAWYKKVCPFCDEKFVDPYQTRKHIECQHKQNYNIKCEQCQKPFQSKQSLHYHKLAQHTVDVQRKHSCKICHQSFLAKVNLDNHVKFKHSDTRKFECKKCNSKFKQRKNLNAHVLNVHGTNPRKEDYWQDLQKETFKCEVCGKEFIRKTDLKVHFKNKHAIRELFECEKCGEKFSYKKSLERHKLEKHGPDVRKYECQDCGKLFNQKRNMERHQLSHVKK